jgi:phosphatidate phosphatase APP1
MDAGQDSSPVGRAVNLRWLLAIAPAAVIALTAAPVHADDDPALIQIYNGVGTTARACLWGRVLEDKGRAPKKRSSWYRKLKGNIKALESDEIPHAKLLVKVAGRKVKVKADGEGLFKLELAGPLPLGSHPVSAKLRDDDRKVRVAAGRLLIFPAAKKGAPAPVAVISDIDDTVLRTGVGSKVKMALKVLTTSAHDLKSFSGAPALFKAWGKRGYPVVFVSGSPVNLYPKLTRFLKLRGFPAAPLLLKDFGGKFAMTEQVAYKLAHIKEVARLLPGYRFLLVGDSGEADPEVYRKVAQRYRGRVVATMINKVEGKQRTKAELGKLKGQIFFDGYPALARVLVKRGLLTAAEARAVAKGGGSR